MYNDTDFHAVILEFYTFFIVEYKIFYHFSDSF